MNACNNVETPLALKRAGLANGMQSDSCTVGLRRLSKQSKTEGLRAEKAPTVEMPSQAWLDNNISALLLPPW